MLFRCCVCVCVSTVITTAIHVMMVLMLVSIRITTRFVIFTFIIHHHRLSLSLQHLLHLTQIWFILAIILLLSQLLLLLAASTLPHTHNLLLKLCALRSFEILRRASNPEERFMRFQRILRVRLDPGEQVVLRQIIRLNEIGGIFPRMRIFTNRRRLLQHTLVQAHECASFRGTFLAIRVGIHQLLFHVNDRLFIEPMMNELRQRHKRRQHAIDAHKHLNEIVHIRVGFRGQRLHIPIRAMNARNNRIALIGRP
mmetsp:Transcript_12648/g.19153  ORF Transcript_12648/g.19153 Transcript_12648/m.19153 type:complete len:254 (-) Transcript_12648:941-1702(-)